MINSLGVIDLDAMLHIVAYVQFSSGNHDRPEQVKTHIKTFLATIKKSSKCDKFIGFYQKDKHQNFRNEILPEYKKHRTRTEFISLWKPTILDAFEESGALGLSYIESDDACSVIAALNGPLATVIMSSDKDMKQTKSHHYNPFKKGDANDPTRWSYSAKLDAARFYWSQVLTGDPTDMPGTLCGIEGVAEKTALKSIGIRSDYITVVQEEYTKKYGAKIGLARAILTMKMVRLLDGSDNDKYANEKALEEVDYIKKNWKLLITKPTASISFTKGDAANLFL
jgi:5'-3' exonuclease